MIYESTLWLKLIFSLVILILTVSFGLVPLLKRISKDKESWAFAESIATGIFLGAGILHLLPDAATEFAKENYQYPFAFLLAMLSFFVLLLLEHLAQTMHKNYQKFTTQLALITTLMLSIHSFLEGAAVGVTTEIATASLIFIAIFAHKGAAAFALALQLRQGGMSVATRCLAFSFFALMTPLGIILGSALAAPLDHVKIVVACLNAFAAGTFLYIGTLHGLERTPLIRHCCNMREFFLMSLGFTLMAVLAKFV